MYSFEALMFPVVGFFVYPFFGLCAWDSWQVVAA
jgi:hypothetical protein